MSNPESFIDEVTEEVRRDRLFANLRKYGWIGIVAVFAIVGGAAYVEWSNARDARQAQAAGDAILEAMNASESASRIEALEALSVEGDTQAVVALMEAAEAQEPAQADATLAAMADNAALPTLYRDLATLKRVLIADSPMTPEDKIAALEPLTQGGAFRVLAEEQTALAEIAAGDTASALERFTVLMDDAESSDSLRQRAEEMIVALGGETE